MTDSRVVIIAGSGLAGLLTLARLSREKPEWNFIVIEREPWHGGRMRPSLAAEGSRSCGLQSASTDLLQFTLDTLQKDNANQVVRPMRSLGVMTGQKIQELAFEELTTSALAKAIAGGPGAKDWAKVEELLAQDPMSEDALNQLWKHDKKSAALVVLEQLAHFWGVPELSGSSIRPLQSGYRAAKQGLWTGRWDLLFDDMLANLRAENRLQLVTRAQIMAANYENKTWTLSTTQGDFQGTKLHVAQSPWEAILWLPKDNWPSRLINIASKTKPVSLVMLSEINDFAGLPDLLFVTAEDTQVLSLDGQIVYQTPINYELTVQAPAVGKAVKRLKRARKKLVQMHPDIGPDGAETLALLTVGWSHSIHPPEYKWFEKLDAAHIQKPHLTFAGDSIGAETTGDRNLIQSVNDATESLLG